MWQEGESNIKDASLKDIATLENVYHTKNIET
jgi:soluble cytochrome b562